MEILEAAIRYIDSLHGQLVASVESAGLPSVLRRQIEENQSGDDGDAFTVAESFLIGQEGQGPNGPENGLPRQNWVAFGRGNQA